MTAAFIFDNMRKKTPQIPVLLGPTAVGKSAIALELCRLNDWELVSLDSRQVYRGMDVGTAKPSLDEMEATPHHLIDTLSPSDEYSAARWADDAREVIEDILKRGKLPLICGGTFFYLQALKEGMTNTDDSPLAFREECRALEEKTPGALHALLLQEDPERASVLHEHDIQRLIRALYKVRHQSNKPEVEVPLYDFVTIVLYREREKLYNRINTRVDAMVKAGLYEEFDLLCSKGFNQESPGLKCVGYQEFFNYIGEGVSFADTVEKIKQNTRKFAKRQMTWLRNKQEALVKLDITNLPLNKSIKLVQEQFKTALHKSIAERSDCE